MYFYDMNPTGHGPQRLDGLYSNITPMQLAKICNIEMDPHEDLNVGGVFTAVLLPVIKDIEQYLESTKKYPNPPAGTFTQFIGRQTG